MSPNLTERYATAITNRVMERDDLPVKFVFSTIFMVICSALGLLMQCYSFFNSSTIDGPSPELLHSRLVEECEDPKRKHRLIRRAAREFRRKSNEPLSHEDSIILAEVTIEEALVTDPRDIQIYAVACGQLSPSEKSYFLAQEETSDGSEDE